MIVSTSTSVQTFLIFFFFQDEDAILYIGVTGVQTCALPILLALPLAAVAATDLDVRGTWGDRTFRPLDVADLDRGYEMGMGSMKVDLRDVQLPPGRTDLHLDMGFGEIVVLVPGDMCVTSHADVRFGAVNVGDGEQAGVDIEDDFGPRLVAPGVAQLHLDVNLGMGEFRLGDSFFRFGPDSPFRNSESFDDLQAGTNEAACRAAS